MADNENWMKENTDPLFKPNQISAAWLARMFTPKKEDLKDPKRLAVKLLAGSLIVGAVGGIGYGLWRGGGALLQGGRVANNAGAKNDASSSAELSASAATAPGIGSASVPSVGAAPTGSSASARQGPAVPTSGSSTGAVRAAINRIMGQSADRPVNTLPVGNNVDIAQSMSTQLANNTANETPMQSPLARTMGQLKRAGSAALSQTGSIAKTLGKLAEEEERKKKAAEAAAQATALSSSGGGRTALAEAGVNLAPTQTSSALGNFQPSISGSYSWLR